MKIIRFQPRYFWLLSCVLLFACVNLERSYPDKHDFVLEVGSDIVQIVSFKMTGRRILRMAPLHHHFEQKGWEESKIVIRFWIIAVVLAIAGLATLKLR